jgi:hypothetical protein
MGLNRAVHQINEMLTTEKRLAVAEFGTMSDNGTDKLGTADINIINNSKRNVRTSRENVLKPNSEISLAIYIGLYIETGLPRTLQKD